LNIPIVFPFQIEILMPRLQRAVPYLGYILIVGEKPASAQRGAEAQAGEVAEGLSPERMS
jgi:hypothetical protein